MFFYLVVMQIDFNGTSQDLETTRITGDHNTLNDIRCRFPHSVNKRSTTSSTAFITGYKIAVSNNNRNFSDAHAIYILDSTCQDTMNVSGQLRFVLKVFSLQFKRLNIFAHSKKMYKTIKRLI